MSAFPDGPRLPLGAMAGYVGAVALLTFLVALATFAFGPGGDAQAQQDLAGKRLQLLKELIPTLKRVAMLSHPPHPTNAVQLQGAEAAALAAGVPLEAVPVRGAADFSSALKALRGVDGVLNVDTPLFVTNRARLVEALARSGLPAIYPSRAYVEAGGSCRTTRTS